jgi:hypothetical protein
MKGNFINFDDATSFLKLMTSFSTNNFYFYDFTQKLSLLSKLLLELCFIKSRNEVLSILDRLISQVEKSIDESDTDYTLVPLSQVESEKLTSIIEQDSHLAIESNENKLSKNINLDYNNFDF